MIINEEGTYNLVYTATDECGNETVVNRELVVEVPIYSWSTGTDEQIVDMIQRADRGEINLADYWHVGDERVVHLDAMEATGVGESHAAQDVTLVLMNAGGKTLNTPTEGGRTTCSFIVGMKNCLNEHGYMNSTDTSIGGWDACARRTWCNNIFYNSIPASLRPIFKQVKNKTGSLSSGTGVNSFVDSIDYFAFPAEYEVFGTYNNSSETYESGLQQFEYYQTSANRIKQRNGSANNWWDRSPRKTGATSFCDVNSIGTTDRYNASSLLGISTFGCI